MNPQMIWDNLKQGGSKTTFSKLKMQELSHIID
jgi:hypothetical protein